MVSIWCYMDFARLRKTWKHNWNQSLSICFKDLALLFSHIMLNVTACSGIICHGQLDTASILLQIALWWLCPADAAACVSVFPLALSLDALGFWASEWHGKICNAQYLWVIVSQIRTCLMNESHCPATNNMLEIYLKKTNGCRSRIWKSKFE